MSIFKALFGNLAQTNRIWEPIIPPPKNYPRAATHALIVFAGWPLSDAFLKIAREDGISQGKILLICGLSSVVTLALLSAFRKRMDQLRPRNWPGLFSLGLCQIAGFVFWMYALPKMPLANMYVVSFLSPMTVACMAAFFLKESLDWKRATAIAVGFSGVVVAINPAAIFQDLNHGLPYLFLFGNMLASSIQMFLLRLVADKESSESTAFYSRLFVAIFGLALCVGTTNFFPMRPSTFLALCGSGVLGGIGWNMLAQAYKCAPAAAVAPFQYTQIIWSALIGYLLWRDLPNAHMLGGSAIVIGSALYLFRRERRISRTMSRVD